MKFINSLKTNDSNKLKRIILERDREIARLCLDNYAIEEEAKESANKISFLEIRNKELKEKISFYHSENEKSIAELSKLSKKCILVLTRMKKENLELISQNNKLEAYSKVLEQYKIRCSLLTDENHKLMNLILKNEDSSDTYSISSSDTENENREIKIREKIVIKFRKMSETWDDFALSDLSEVEE